MVCPRCNALNQEGASFCQNCGEGLTNYSPVNNQEKWRQGPVICINSNGLGMPGINNMAVVSKSSYTGF
ncbi:zinc-ribbon domain-containing protein [Mucilaginibacter sp.]|uniref:zinc-ribbon domain-containing protein n=1 Tax=Mucilaginibacter sp. TaxID=1882438 RepID=UPI003450DC50